MSFPCPHCGKVSYTRTSSQLSKMTKETQYRCERDECGHVFVVLAQAVRTVSPSAMPAPDVYLPMSPRKLPAPNPADQGSLI